MNQYLKELARQLPKYDCSAEYDDEYKKLRIMNEGQEICLAHDNGEIRYRSENHQTKEQRELYFTIQDTAFKSKEYVDAYENASALSADGLRDGYRLITEHNGIVLAAKDMKEHGFEFVTWRRSYDSKSVGNGNYFTDYDAAKQDFAIRSGLVNQLRLFSNEQLENVYRSLEFTKEINDCLTYDYEKELESLMHHIEKILPYVSQDKQQYSAKDSCLPINEFIVQHKMLDEACRQWCDFINDAPERRDGIGFTEFYEEICRQKYSEYIDEMEYDEEQEMQLNM